MPLSSSATLPRLRGLLQRSKLRPVRAEAAAHAGAAEPRDRLEARRRRRKRWRWGVGAALASLLLLILLLALTAPLSKSLQPITAPSLTLLSAEGRPIARRGAVLEEPVNAGQLPRHVVAPFLAIEDRRFYDHPGVDARSLARAALRNLREGEIVEGGSTITQQLAKLAFLSPEQTLWRKLQEFVLAFWLEAWLSKDEILSRYLSSVYFGDNVFGLRAAANHYFSRKPEELTQEQAAMLAGLLKAPSALAPTRNLAGARERAAMVIEAMVATGMLRREEARRLPPARLKRGPAKNLPSGTYFADWVFPQAEAALEGRPGRHRIVTTLEDRLQREAVKAIRSAGLGGAQVALVAMRPDGRVVAMVGGKNYRRSPFNRATQARRQPGSTFKLFVYLAALRAGHTPDSTVLDEPLRLGSWSPENHGDRYRGEITLREAFAISSNVAAVRLAEAAGRENVRRAARDLGLTGAIEDGPSSSLGTSGVPLIELVAAYAAVSAGRYPVRPRGLPGDDAATPATPMEEQVRAGLLELLWAAANEGTGGGAVLPVQTFGKTGTSQDSRDGYFIGFAGDLIAGVWIGYDDNRPISGMQGGGLPARIWRRFMESAVAAKPGAATPIPEPEELPAEPDGADEMPFIYREYDVEEGLGEAPALELAIPPEGTVAEGPPLELPPPELIEPPDMEAPVVDTPPLPAGEPPFDPAEAELPPEEAL